MCRHSSWPACADLTPNCDEALRFFYAVGAESDGDYMTVTVLRLPLLE